jgi:hypothetical protein
MISQKCPRCRSKKVRLGYRPTPIWSALVCRFNLLCDNCNWEFAGFAVPGTTSSKKKKIVKKTPDSAQENDLGEISTGESKKERSAKRSGAAIF